MRLSGKPPFQSGFFGLEATNTSFLAKLVEDNPTPTAIESLVEADWVHAFPNPASKQLTVQFSGSGDFQLSFHDLQGRLLQQQALGQVASAQVSLADVAPGLYLLSVENRRLN